MAQWWEHSPPTNVVRVQILASTPYVGWVCCWFSPLLREVFLRVLRFSHLPKNQHLQIPIRSGIRYTKNHFVPGCATSKSFYSFIYFRFVFSQKYSRGSRSLLPGGKGKFPRGTWVFSKLQGLEYYFPDNFRCNLTFCERENFSDSPFHHIF